MQLTQALTLVPERKREDKEEDIGSAHMSMDSIVEFLTSPARDIPVIEFDLPKILGFYSKKGKDDSEARDVFGGVRKFLSDSWEEEEEASLIGEIIEKVVGSGVRRLGMFVARVIWGTIWRITKWLVKEVAGGVIRMTLRYLVVPALEAVVGFLFTPVGIALALTGGALAAGYFVYKAFFDKSVPEKPKQEDQTDALGYTIDAASADLTRAPETTTQKTPGSSSVASTPAKTSQGSLTTGAAVAEAPMGAGAPVAAGPPPSGDVKQMIIRHEGVKLQPYKDSLGLWTIGVGHLIGDGKSLPDEFNRTFTKEEVYALFDEDFEKHRKAAMNIPNFSRLGEKAQAAFIDLTFNMGPGWFKRWPSLVQSMKDFDIAAVIENLRTSRWAKQVQASRVSDVLSLLGTELSRTDAAAQTPKITPGVTTAATTQNQVKDASTAARPGVAVTPPNNDKTIIKTSSGQLVATNMN
jgi:GH24 family phage-related lysozyme (muramidase)